MEWSFRFSMPMLIAHSRVIVIAAVAAALAACTASVDVQPDEDAFDISSSATVSSVPFYLEYEREDETAELDVRSASGAKSSSSAL